jgi:hypothetical protein
MHGNKAFFETSGTDCVGVGTWITLRFDGCVKGESTHG